LTVLPDGANAGMFMQLNHRNTAAASLSSLRSMEFAVAVVAAIWAVKSVLIAPSGGLSS
jgi:hypothetical protein